MTKEKQTQENQEETAEEPKILQIESEKVTPPEVFIYSDARKGVFFEIHSTKYDVCEIAGLCQNALRDFEKINTAIPDYIR